MSLGPHAQKEDMALLPMLDDMMDAETEAAALREIRLEHALRDHAPTAIARARSPSPTSSRSSRSIGEHRP